MAINQHIHSHELVSLMKAELSFEPTGEQHALMLALDGYLKNPSGLSLFVLTGYAGTGKTTMLGALVKALKKVKWKTRLLAPTGRAAKVLSGYSGQIAFTIHKQIYWPPDDSSRLTLQRNLHSNTIFIVDEASMIPDDTGISEGTFHAQHVLQDLLNYIFQGKNCYLIFLGDPGQLPPIGCQQAPALNVEAFQKSYPALSIQNVQLKEVLRQSSDSGILKLATQIRLSGSKCIGEWKSSADVLKITGDELADYLETAYNAVGMDEVLVITRSNKRANAFNQFIRNRLLWMEDDLCGGDRLMVVKNNYFWTPTDSTMGFIANGEMAEIVRIKKRVRLYDSDFAHVILRFIDYPLEEHDVIIMLECLYVDGPSVTRNRLKDLFFEIEKDYDYEKNKKKRYALILKNPYFNALQVKFAYAVTCHKAQGGQWHQVFVDGGGKRPDASEEEEKKWLYTAVTRAQEKLYLLNAEQLASS